MGQRRKENHVKDEILHVMKENHVKDEILHVIKKIM